MLANRLVGRPSQRLTLGTVLLSLGLACHVVEAQTSPTRIGVLTPGGDSYEGAIVFYAGTEPVTVALVETYAKPNVRLTGVQAGRPT